MKNRIFLFLGVSLVALFINGCQKAKTYPDVPHIDFVSLTKERTVAGPDSATIITISFTDGDGDIGYNSSGDNGAIFDSTSSIYYNDFIVNFFQKQNGVWVQDTVDHFSGRLPYLTPDGSNKALAGDISQTQVIEFTRLYNNGINDTVHYQVYIYDRALHKSNTITTSDIVISVN